MTGRDFIHRGFGGAATPADIAPVVVMPRTREDAAAIAASWTDARLVAEHYGWTVWTGTTGGVRLTACSAGIGSPSAAIAIEELAILGARTIVAVGEIREPAVVDRAVGAVVVADGAMRLDAASHGYARIGFPAAAHPDVVMAAVAAGRDAGADLRHEIVADVDAALGPRTRAAIREVGAVAVHGSPAVLFTAGAIHGLRTGFLAAAGPSALGRAHAVAVATLTTLVGWDERALTLGDRVASMPDRR